MCQNFMLPSLFFKTQLFQGDERACQSGIAAREDIGERIVPTRLLKKDREYSSLLLLKGFNILKQLTFRKYEIA